MNTPARAKFVGRQAGKLAVALVALMRIETAARLQLLKEGLWIAAGQGLAAVATLVLSVCTFISVASTQKRVPKLKRKFWVLSKASWTTGTA